MEDLINYHEILYPSQDVSNLSHDELFFKINGFSYDQHLKNQEELEKKIDRYEHERIKYRKRILKKNNVNLFKENFFNN